MDNFLAPTLRETNESGDGNHICFVYFGLCEAQEIIVNAIFNEIWIV